MKIRDWRLARIVAAATLILGLTAVGAPTVRAETPPPLETVPIPLPDNLGKYLNSDVNGVVTPEARAAAIKLGKALFWDMQAGSDGTTACASCHFKAGADGRIRNTMSPGLKAGDAAFDVAPYANEVLMKEDFPFHLLSDRHDRHSTVISSANDVVGSQGVTKAHFLNVTPGAQVDGKVDEADTIFNRLARNARRVTGRNTPSAINAVYFFTNFWDGRANHFFNGRNPFGYQDINARVWENVGGTLTPLNLNDPANQLNNASLASQAVGPPMDDTEMSAGGRTWPDLGRKLLTLSPLAKQLVHATDSVLGGLAKSAVTPGAKGLNTTYAELIMDTFQPQFWNAGVRTSDGYTHMEANFSMFFGLAVMMYEATLVSDDTPFDRYAKGDVNALTPRQERGLNQFLSGQSRCTDCHIGPEFSDATVNARVNPEPAGPGEPAPVVNLHANLIELMAMADGQASLYDVGFYNIGVRPTEEDLGRGGKDPFGFPLSFVQQFLQSESLPFTPIGTIFSTVNRPAVDGAFKVPILRNIELTGPYMHNGSMLTLMQVVDFYIRGGNFHEANFPNLDRAIDDIDGLKGDGHQQDREELVDFLIALTDERVRWEKAPFDHPALTVLDGHSTKLSVRDKYVLPDVKLEIPAVGAAGRQSQGLPPIKAFLDGTGNSMDWDRTLHFQP